MKFFLAASGLLVGFQAFATKTVVDGDLGYARVCAALVANEILNKQVETTSGHCVMLDVKLSSVRRTGQGDVIGFGSVGLWCSDSNDRNEVRFRRKLVAKLDRNGNCSGR